MALNWIMKWLSWLKKVPQVVKKTEKISEPIQSVAKTAVTNNKKDAVVKTIQNQDHKRAIKTNWPNKVTNNTNNIINSNNSLVNTAGNVTTNTVNEVPKKNLLKKAFSWVKNFWTEAINKTKPVVKVWWKLAWTAATVYWLYDWTKQAMQAYNDDYSHLDVDEQTRDNFRTWEAFWAFLNWISWWLLYDKDDVYWRRTTWLVAQKSMWLYNWPKDIEKFNYKQSTEDLKKQLERNERIRRWWKASEDKLSLLSKQDEFIRQQLAAREKWLDDSEIATKRLATTNEHFKKMDEKHKDNKGFKDIHFREDLNEVEKENTKEEINEIQEEPTISYWYWAKSKYTQRWSWTNRNRQNYSNNQIDWNSAFWNYQWETWIKPKQTFSLNPTAQNTQSNLQINKELESVDKTWQDYLNPEARIKRKYTQEEIDSMKDPYEKAKMIEENLLIDKLVEQDIKRWNIEWAITRRQADSLIDHSTSWVRSIAAQTENELNKTKLDIEKYENEKNRQHDFDKMSLWHTFDLEKMERNHQYDIDSMWRKHYYEVDLMWRKHYLDLETIWVNHQNDLEKMWVQHQYNLEQDYTRYQNELEKSIALKQLEWKWDDYVSSSLISEAIESWNNWKSSAEIMKELNEVDKTWKSAMMFSEMISWQKRDKFSWNKSSIREFELIAKEEWNVLDTIMNWEWIWEQWYTWIDWIQNQILRKEHQSFFNHLSFIRAKRNQLELLLNKWMLTWPTSDRDLAFLKATNEFNQYVETDESWSRVLSLRIWQDTLENRQKIADAYQRMILMLRENSWYDEYLERQNELKDKANNYY